jgi:hypothetical protein
MRAKELLLACAVQMMLHDYIDGFPQKNRRIEVDDKMRQQRDALVKGALESATWRGHQMVRAGSTMTTKAFECSICGATAYADFDPAPNGIDIGGSAVALNCPSK